MNLPRPHATTARRRTIRGRLQASAACVARALALIPSPWPLSIHASSQQRVELSHECGAIPSERLVEEYLSGRGLMFRMEPDVGGRNPDFVAEIESVTVGMEVYEPELRLPKNFAGTMSTPAALRRGFENRKHD